MALDDLLDEHEQSERVLQWLRENGAGLIGGIVLGLGAIAGWKWWQQHQVQQQALMADQYQATLDAVSSQGKHADAMVKALPAGMYQTLAALALAKTQVDAGQAEAAIATLRATKPVDPAVAQVVNVRLARLLIDAKHADAAVKLLASNPSAEAMEIRGDAQFALGQRDQARVTYTQALAKLDIGAPQRKVLELKLTEVGGTPAKPETQS